LSISWESCCRSSFSKPWETSSVLLAPDVLVAALAAVVLATGSIIA
jgi:hypothetical protein